MLVRICREMEFLRREGHLIQLRQWKRGQQNALLDWQEQRDRCHDYEHGKMDRGTDEPCGNVTRRRQLGRPQARPPHWTRVFDGGHEGLLATVPMEKNTAT